ncbi:MAG: polynucleotide adenylyltransferase PcnB [Gammaproteobacteria bacterium]|nr:polynucleotide adenylyltransferase PcnB [Gammaproteobacteria bacterium]
MTRSKTLLEPQEPHNNILSPIIVERDAHTISRTNISEAALKVLYRLKKADYDAFLVGGGVRDLLLDRHPKDFDIVTNALPEDASTLFRNSRLIGRRFRLVHVHFGREYIEVATFRGHHDVSVTEVVNGRHVEDGMLIRDNVYGTIEEDAWRRDFTINALYYNIQNFSVLDYTGGLADLEKGLIRIIGDAAERYREDPVRMLRAVRFAAKLDFKIESSTEAPIYSLAERINAVPPARLFEEVLKMFLGGSAAKTYELLRTYGLFGKLFPHTEAALSGEDRGAADLDSFIKLGLSNTDARIAQGKPVTPAFLFAILLWGPVQRLVGLSQASGMRSLQAHQQAGAQIIAQQAETVALPKRFSVQTREIWALQPRLLGRSGSRANRLLTVPRFRAAYDFLLLLAETVSPDLMALGQWWTKFQEASEQGQAAMVRKIQSPSRRRRRAQ